MLDTYVSGRIVKARQTALLAPREVVLSEEAGAHVLFTVKDGKAVKHAVKLGLEDDRNVQIVAEDLHAGDTIIVTGSYELEDGMAVTIQEPATKPATSAPATSEGGR